MIYQKSRDVFKREYEFYKECDAFKNKYEWAASHIFDLTTYDGSLDEMFVKLILEVCDVILEDENYEYIKDETNYFTFIAVCQRLSSLGWIDWGTSIRGAWFEDHQNPMLTIAAFKDSVTVYPCKESIRALLDFMEE